jgi:perosamine synthetase
MIPYGKHSIDESDVASVIEVLQSGFLTQGPAVEAFEAAVAEYTGAKYAVAVSSCTAGLHLAAIAAGVGPGRTLLTSPITFVASANAAIYAGGNVAFADIDPATVNMSCDSLERALSAHRNVRAVVPVHFAGLPCEMEKIHATAKQYGAAVIEDAAHALGARHEDGSLVGSCRFSDMTVFSFHPVKNIAAGEGGMITTNDEALYRRLLRLRSHGINKLDDPLQVSEQAFEGGSMNPWYYEMQELGFHYRITDIQCALGLSQLKRLDSFLERRRLLVAAYDEAFRGNEAVRSAQTDGRDRSGHHLYVVRIDFKRIKKTRGEVMRSLRSNNIVTQVHYIPVPAQPFYRRNGFDPADYPEARRYYGEALSLPLYFSLTDAEQEHVIQNLVKVVS